SAEVIYYLDFLPPLCWLPMAFYSGSDYADISWTQKDSSTEIDTVILDLKNGTTLVFDKNTDNVTIQYPGEGEYAISITINDTQGHTIVRDSVVYVDKTNPVIFTVWVDDQFYTGSKRYFRVGITTNDMMSGIANITLNYNISNTQSSYASQMTLLNIRSYRVEFELPFEILNTYTPLNEANITFNFEVYDKVGHYTTCQNFSHELKLDLGEREEGLTAEQILIIIGSIVGAGLIGGFLAYKLKRKREFGDFAKYY
ncbi:MAG: hypothetical protein ACTSRZ_02010, partial [Promethearchaeota archaeon]